jgi:hypothetical protein
MEAVRRPSRTAKYLWRMTADPLLCGGGPQLARLMRCPLPSRGGQCRCRFEINEIIEDLGDAQALEVAGWFETDIDADDVPQLIADFRTARIGTERLAGVGANTEDLVSRLDAWSDRFRELEATQTGLTGRYADDLD